MQIRVQSRSSRKWCGAKLALSALFMEVKIIQLEREFCAIVNTCNVYILTSDQSEVINHNCRLIFTSNMTEEIYRKQLYFEITNGLPLQVFTAEKDLYKTKTSFCIHAVHYSTPRMLCIQTGVAVGGVWRFPADVTLTHHRPSVSSSFSSSWHFQRPAGQTSCLTQFKH